MKKTGLFFLCMLVCSAAMTQVSAFLGNWEGKGILMGNEADFEIGFHYAVKETCLEINFRHAYKTKEGVVRNFEARGIYRISDEHNASGYWFDSRPVTLPVQVAIGKGELVCQWGDSASVEEGKTIYTITGEGKLEVKDYVLRSGEYKPFGTAIYERRNGMAAVDKLKLLKVLQGTWERTNAKEGQRTLETWTWQETNMTGLGFTLTGSDTTFAERLTLLTKDNEVYYSADVDHNPAPVLFKLTRIEGSEFVFENPQHDFPKTIRYRIVDAGAMEVKISDGRKTVLFSFRRIGEK